MNENWTAGCFTSAREMLLDCCCCYSQEHVAVLLQETKKVNQYFPLQFAETLAAYHSIIVFLSVLRTVQGCMRPGARSSLEK